MAVPEEIQEKVLAEATSATPNYEIDYNDERFSKVDQQMDDTWNEYSQTVGGMINDVDGYYQKLQDQSQEWADKQAQLQQENTDFAIEKIEQQKEQAQKDYLKEQSGAYVDWQKQSNQYGVEAEKMASAGLSQTGYSESSQVSMYNTYQNRVATAREVFAQAKLNYDNGIKEAMLQNNATLAQIYADSYKEQLTLALEGFQYKNQLVLDLADKKLEIENTKWNRYQDILNQMNTENALKENIRQFNTELDWKTEQAEIDRQFQEKENELDRAHDLERDRINNEFTAKENELNRKHAIELEGIRDKYEKEQIKIKHENEMAKLKKEQEYDLEQLDKKLENDKALLKYEQSLTSSSSSGGSAKITGSSGSNAKATTSYSTTSYNQKITNDEKKTNATAEASAYLNKLIASGATKTQVLNAINDAVKAGAITSQEAAKLRKTFTPTGITY